MEEYCRLFWQYACCLEHCLLICWAVLQAYQLQRALARHPETMRLCLEMIIELH